MTEKWINELHDSLVATSADSTNDIVLKKEDIKKSPSKTPLSPKIGLDQNPASPKKDALASDAKVTKASHSPSKVVSPSVH